MTYIVQRMDGKNRSKEEMYSWWHLRVNENSSGYGKNKLMHKGGLFLTLVFN